MDEQRIDMTGQGEELRVLEVLTDAGIIRVNTNLVNTSAPAVVVEVEPNMAKYGIKKTAPGGHWEAEITDRAANRIDVTLTREG